jgi:hypothetical protein
MPLPLNALIFFAVKGNSGRMYDNAILQRI